MESAKLNKIAGNLVDELARSGMTALDAQAVMSMGFNYAYFLTHIGHLIQDIEKLEARMSRIENL